MNSQQAARALITKLRQSNVPPNVRAAALNYAMGRIGQDRYVLQRTSAGVPLQTALAEAISRRASGMSGLGSTVTDLIDSITGAAAGAVDAVVQIYSSVRDSQSEEDIREHEQLMETGAQAAQASEAALNTTLAELAALRDGDPAPTADNNRTLPPPPASSMGTYVVGAVILVAVAGGGWYFLKGRK